MNDKAADKYVAEWASTILEAKGEDQRLYLMRQLVKEVERDTRHRCASLSQHLTNDIHNLDWDKPITL